MFSQLNCDFHRAIELGDIREVRRCLDGGAKIEQKSGCGYTPLFTAVWRNQIEIIKLLLARGANVENTVHGTTPISTASTAEAALLLIDGGLDIDPPRSHVMWHACQRGTGWLVELLLDRGVPVDRKTYNGDRPLFQACRDRRHLVEMLLRRGASVESMVPVPLRWGQEFSILDYQRWLGNVNPIVTERMENAPPADRRLLAHWVLRIRLHVVGAREHLGSARRGLLHRPLLCTIASFLIGPIRPFSS